MADDRSGLVFASPWGVRIRMGDSCRQGTEYASAHYRHESDLGTRSSGDRLARAHRITVLIIAILLITIPLIICVTTGR